MKSLDITNINWDQMWRQIKINPVPNDLPAISDEERYDHMAPLFKEWMRYDDYPSKMLERIQVKQEWSVLDIGCGTGAIAIPTAMKVKSVTAIDISTHMLKILKNDIEKNHIVNLKPKHLNWDNIRVGIDIHPHDVVIMSRSIGRMINLRESLIKVDQAASRYVYISAWSGKERQINRGIMEALGKEYHDIPDYLYVFNILAQMGINPSVEHLKCSSKVVYPNITEALHTFQNLLHLDPTQLDAAKVFLEENLVKRDDGWLENPDNKPVWSLIWWKKEDS